MGSVIQAAASPKAPCNVRTNLSGPRKEAKMQNPIAVTIPEAVRLSGISRTGIYAALQSGLKARKSGRRTLIEYADLQAYLASLPAYRAGA